MSKKRILVTGAGALLGQGILRCIQPLRDDYYVVSVDPDFRSTGYFLSDVGYTIPMANDPAYLPALINIIEKEAIQLLFVGTDVELPLLSQEKMNLEAKHGVKIVVSDPEVIRIANDKWATAEFLKNNGMAFPLSVLASDQVAMNQLLSKAVYPLFAKPRDGARSKGVRIINNAFDLNEVIRVPGNLVVQEFLEETDGEYTAGCLVLDGKCRSMVVLRRDLRDGNTWRAYSDTSGKYDQFLKLVAETLKVKGPCNFQFRIRDNQPVIFEINARFSGTTPLRMIFGFNEVKAVLDHYFLGIDEFKVEISEGAILRTFSDLYIPNGKLEAMKSSGQLKNPVCKEYPFLIKSFGN